jgi:hypothetical protein
MAAPPAASETAFNAMIDNAPSDSNGATAEATQGNSGLSADDFALYDRQIRLWGSQAQERIRNAHILLVSLRALGTEIAKNLTLAGISSLTIVDDEPVTEEDLGSCYFLRDEDVGKPVCYANFDINAIKRACDANIIQACRVCHPAHPGAQPSSFRHFWRGSFRSAFQRSDLL